MIAYLLKFRIENRLLKNLRLYLLIFTLVWLVFYTFATLLLLKGERSLDRLQGWPHVMGEAQYISVGRDGLSGFYKYEIDGVGYIKENPYLHKDNGSIYEFRVIEETTRDLNGKVDVVYNPERPYESAILTYHYAYNPFFEDAIELTRLTLLTHLVFLIVSIIHIIFGKLKPQYLTLSKNLA